MTLGDTPKDRSSSESDIHPSRAKDPQSSVSASHLTHVSPPSEVEDSKQVSGEPALPIIDDPMRQVGREIAPCPQSVLPGDSSHACVAEWASLQRAGRDACRPHDPEQPLLPWCLQERPSMAAQTRQVTGDSTPPAVSRKRSPTWTAPRTGRSASSPGHGLAGPGLAREQESASLSPSCPSEHGHSEPAAWAVARGLPWSLLHVLLTMHPAFRETPIRHGIRQAQGWRDDVWSQGHCLLAVSSVLTEPDTPFPRAGGRHSTLPKCCPCGGPHAQSRPGDGSSDGDQNQKQRASFQRR